MDWNYNIKRAILLLLLILGIAWMTYGHEVGKVCYIARMDNKHIWLEPKPCSKSEAPTDREKQPAKPQPSKLKRT